MAVFPGSKHETRLSGRGTLNSFSTPYMRLDFSSRFPLVLICFDLGSVAAEIAAESLVPISAMPRVFPAASKSLHRGKLDEIRPR